MFLWHVRRSPIAKKYMKQKVKQEVVSQTAMSVLITILVLGPRKGTKIKVYNVWNLTDGRNANTALSALNRRRQTMEGDPVLKLFQTIYQEETKLQ